MRSFLIVVLILVTADYMQCKEKSAETKKTTKRGSIGESFGVGSDIYQIVASNFRNPVLDTNINGTIFNGINQYENIAGFNSFESVNIAPKISFGISAGRQISNYGVPVANTVSTNSANVAANTYGNAERANVAITTATSNPATGNTNNNKGNLIEVNTQNSNPRSNANSGTTGANYAISANAPISNYENIASYGNAIKNIYDNFGVNNLIPGVNGAGNFQESTNGAGISLSNSITNIAATGASYGTSLADCGHSSAENIKKFDDISGFGIFGTHYGGLEIANYGNAIQNQNFINLESFPIVQQIHDPRPLLGPAPYQLPYEILSPISYPVAGVQVPTPQSVRVPPTPVQQIVPVNMPRTNIAPIANAGSQPAYSGNQVEYSANQVISSGIGSESELRNIANDNNVRNGYQINRINIGGGLDIRQGVNGLKTSGGSFDYKK